MAGDNLLRDFGALAPLGEDNLEDEIERIPHLPLGSAVVAAGPGGPPQQEPWGD